MTIDAWWPRLRPESRQWLIVNNGDAVPTQIVDEIATIGGPAAADAWWSSVEDAAGHGMPDDAVDWIEAAANRELEGA